MKTKDATVFSSHFRTFRFVSTYERLRRVEAAYRAGVRIKFKRAHHRSIREAMKLIRAGEGYPPETPRGYLLARLNLLRRTLWPADPTSEGEILADARSYQSAAECFAEEKRFCELAAHLNVCSALGVDIEVAGITEPHRILVKAIRLKVG